MPRAPVYLNQFDHGAEYDVAKPFMIGRRQFGRGERFDKDRIPRRRLRQLYEMRFLVMVDDGTDRRRQGSRLPRRHYSTPDSITVRYGRPLRGAPPEPIPPEHIDRAALEIGVGPGVPGGDDAPVEAEAETPAEAIEAIDDVELPLEGGDEPDVDQAGEPDGEGFTFEHRGNGHYFAMRGGERVCGPFRKDQREVALAQAAQILAREAAA